MNYSFKNCWNSDWHEAFAKNVFAAIVNIIRFSKESKPMLATCKVWWREKCKKSVEKKLKRTVLDTN